MFILSFYCGMTVFIVGYKTSIFAVTHDSLALTAISSGGQGLVEAHWHCGLSLCPNPCGLGRWGLSGTSLPCRTVFQGRKSVDLSFGTKTAWIYLFFYQCWTSLIFMRVLLGVSGYKENKNTALFIVFWPVCHHLLSMERFNYKCLIKCCMTAWNIKLLLKQKSTKVYLKLD